MASPSPTPDVPLEIEPLIGWRVWKLSRNFLGELRLRAVVHPHEWAPQSAERAVCSSYLHRERRHDAPQQTCTCGYYAADSLSSLGTSNVFSNGGIGAIGAIAMWGTVIQHANGARSEFAYPARLRLVCSTCIQKGQAVDPAIVTGGPDPRPLCDRHARGVGGPVEPAERVQAELLATYAVDLLPAPKIPRSRTAKDPHLVRDGVSMVFGVLFMLVRVVIGAWIALWLLGLALTIVAVIVGGVMNVVSGSNPPTPTSSAAVLPAYARPLPAYRPWLGVEPHRGVPQPRPVPEMTTPCGVGHGSWVELVRCGDPRADLIGLGMQEPPHGKARDCLGSDEAYTAGHGWWICWIELPGGAWVHPWPHAANPFATSGGS